MDDENEDFRKEDNQREFECEAVMKGIKKKFEDGKVGGPNYFNQDLPIQLHSFLSKEILYKLIFADNFQTNKFLRDESKTLFEEVFKHWEGEITKKAMNDVITKIEIADEMGRNNTFSWYVNVVSKFLMK